MTWLDPFSRGATIAILAVSAFLWAREQRWIPSARAGILFVFTIASHLILTSPGYERFAVLDGVLKTAALVAPGAFFVFSRALFDDEGRFTPRDASLFAALIASGWLRTTQIARAATIVYYAASLAAVLFALARVVRGFPSDLVEPRRRFRAIFTGLVGLQILIVIGAEILVPARQRTYTLETLKSTGAFVLAALFAIWFLTPRRELFVAESPAQEVVPDDPVAAEDARYRERLLSLMRDERAYREEGLTIAALAQKLDLPEYRLRRIINQQLGYRNFNAFLNDLRVEEACRILADPGQERLPILNLALDLGYGSPGAFNRAFRGKTGQTPTAYRRARLSTAVRG